MTCDRHSSARAAYVVYTRSGLLYFCGHCVGKHEPVFMARGYRVVSLEDHKRDAGQRFANW